MEALRENFIFLLPLFLINLALIAVALVDLVKREKVPGGSKWLWGAAIVFIQYLGPLAYLVLGRKED
ncbi:MAG TPA: PLD nuclease N-terminal domain-containing protein [Bacillota bacterium]|jgi:hypothetical protein|nr:PLDc_N domain-containing protein [Bacillota bacterium]HOB87640.1 PLD nuclease N-terminal domain-containing protein [Bacillota bacterium]HOP68376.1 PLD nuclease N-terminal domain-containing protein [Bacillota bacterium]HPT33455.1 PLD nuclease N-terminal domain-containing protein [Bacillota bacterium]HPZ65186.1 PLD nuclease N-terminal domain-containing protein [Bacillota bacterium]